MFKSFFVILLEVILKISINSLKTLLKLKSKRILIFILNLILNYNHLKYIFH